MVQGCRALQGAVGEGRTGGSLAGVNIEYWLAREGWLLSLTTLMSWPNMGNGVGEVWDVTEESFGINLHRLMWFA